MIIKNILIGEDLRQEIGNKLSMMGIFGGSLNLNIPANAPNDIPPVVPLSFLISILNNDPENNLKDYAVQVDISIGENSFANIKALFESDEIDHIIHLPISKIFVPAADKSILKVHAQILKNGKLISEETTILKINFNRLPPSAK